MFIQVSPSSKAKKKGTLLYSGPCTSLWPPSPCIHYPECCSPPWLSHLVRSVHPQTTMPFCLPGRSLWRRRHWVSLPLHKTHYTKDKLLFIAATQCWFYRGNPTNTIVCEGEEWLPVFFPTGLMHIKILFQHTTSTSSSLSTPGLSFITPSSCSMI